MGDGRRCGEGWGAGAEEPCRKLREALPGFASSKNKLLLGGVTQRLISAGARPQPRVHFQRRALRLPENTSYSDLTAFLTAAGSPSEVDSFPYLRGLDGNGTGNSSLFSFVFDSLYVAGRVMEGFVLTGRPEVAEWGALSTSSSALKLFFQEFCSTAE